MTDMTEIIKAKWNGHTPEVIPMVDDEGTFPIDGKSVLLKRGKYGLLCNWITTPKGGCFDVLPVEILDDGTLRKAEQSPIDFAGGLDIWSQGYGILSWREGQDKATAHIPADRELSSFENPTDARRPKLVVFIPPEGLNTKADDSTRKPISKVP